MKTSEDLTYNVAEIAKWALDELRAVDHGSVKVYYVGLSWDSVYAGDVYFITSHGWLFTVFNDCDEWGYLDSFKSPAGQGMGYEDIQKYPVSNFSPDNPAMWSDAPSIITVFPSDT